MRAADYEHKNQNGWPYLCFQGCDWPLLSDETTQKISEIKSLIKKSKKKKKKKKKKRERNSDNHNEKLGMWRYQKVF